MFSGANLDYINDAMVYFNIVLAGNFFYLISLTMTAAQRGVGNTPYTVLDRGGLSKRAAENRVNMVADLLGREE